MIITCQECNGAGTVNGQSCGRCNGDGEIDLLSDDMKKVSTAQDAAIRGQVWSEILSNQETIISNQGIIIDKCDALQAKCDDIFDGLPGH